VPHLALITPWPPQASGIADYALDLAIGLSQQGANVTVFTDERTPTIPGHDVRVLHVSEFRGLDPYDRVIYQMGNHPRFHSAMIPLLAKYGGIVHLHDMVLQHLVAFFTCGQGNRHHHHRLLQYWYGKETLDEFLAWSDANRKHLWQSDRVTEIPLFEPILRFAQGCFVHSRFAQQRVNQRLPWLSCKIIPQVYRNMEVVHSPANSRFRIGVFGSVQPHKHVDKVLRAIALGVAEGADIELDIVGSLDLKCKALPQLATELGLQHRTTWHGRTEEAKFLRIMQSVDLCLALRYPTMGETSAVVSRTLQMGVPTIVNNVGWYAELPSVVRKVPVDPDLMQSELNDLIPRHATDAGYHRQARQQAVEYARASIDFARVSARYLQILDEFLTPPTPALTPILRSA
jgi:glycosyltransferase involved in cell wall biosynthesis